MIPISIKKNDAFEFLCASIGKGQSATENYIIKKVKQEIPTFGSFEDINVSLLEFFTENGYTEAEILKCVFPNEKGNDEIITVLDKIIFWGVSYDNECDNCGCEMDVETEREGNHSWANYECPNPYCKEKATDCPDFDTMKGGKDYGR